MSFFTGMRSGAFYNGQFNVIDGNQYNINNAYHYTASYPVLQILWEAISDVGAFHDSIARYPHIKCHPNTRVKEQRTLLEWIRNPDGFPFCWLYGPAGHGKTTIAQTVSEESARDGTLVSSFFFSRNDPKRENSTHLFLTIAYGLASSIPLLREMIGQVIQSNPDTLRSSPEIQFRELIMKPCRWAASLWEFGWPRLVIIDGLDECQRNDVQKKILDIISSPFRESERLPLRFLICSRPEPTIREFFESHALYHYTMRLPLDSSREGSHDIRIYLRERLDEIRHKPKFRGVEFPNPWPPPGAVEKLAQKASRQFLYASTVIAFVDGEFSEPCGRLEVILNLKPNLDADSPFRPLDVLYEHVLSVNPNRDQVVTILGFIVCSLSQTSIFATPNNIELLLNLPRGQVMLALRGMHSVLHIPGPHFPVEILHASFTEFLLDKSRSGFFYVGQAHFRSFAALHVVRYLNKNLFVLKRSPLELKSASLLSVVWDQWHALCLDVEKPTEELLSEIERLDWKAMYGIQTQLAIWNFSTDGDWSKEWRSFLYVFPEILQNLCSKEPNTLVERFAAGREGFHVSVSSSSSPSVLNVALAALAAGAWNLREHWFHSLFRDLTARWGDRLQRVRDEVRVIHLQRCPKCTSTLHHTPAPTECSSGIFYVRTQHIFASMLSTLIGLVRSPDTSTPTSDTTSEAIGALLTPRALYPQAECLLTLAGPVPELIPLMQEVFSKVLECQGVYLVEEMLVNLLGWLEVFPEDPEPGTDSLVRRIRDWAVSTKRKARGGFRQLYYNDLCEKLQLSQEPDV